MSAEAVLERLRTDMPFYAENCLKIIDKDARLIPFKLNAGQLALDAKLEEQRLQNKPMRALVLKARQVGFSTYAQAKLLQRTTLYENQNAVVVAHDVKTGDKLYRMGETMYGSLPEDPAIKPPIRGHRRGRFLHFAPPGSDAWKKGDIWPNSTYFVDTASEFEAGRGGTFQLAHLSEFAFWDRPLDKLTALGSAIPRRPDTLLIIESTANGMNLYRDLWVDAEEGRSEFIPFFWPWWKEPTYSLPFANEAEHQEYLKHEYGVGPWGEEEPELREMGVSDEQLHWRRKTIAGPECAGKLDKFHQEYPSNAEQAFVTTGRQVFDTSLVRNVLIECDITDPKRPDEKHPGPLRGTFGVGAEKESADRQGDKITVPTSALWVPREDALTTDLVRLWLPEGLEERDQFVIGVDVSGGQMTDGAPNPAFHAVQVVNHKTREQVGEYRSHIDPNALAKLIYLAALYFNNAWVAVEVTGGWGLPVIRRIFHDYNYPYIYIRPSHERTSEDRSKMLGWHTTTATKPLIEANAAEMLREGSHGIKSRALALEMLSYVKDDRGRTGPEPGRFSDLLIAWMIAQQVASELPIRHASSRPAQPWTPHDPITGY